MMGSRDERRRETRFPPGLLHDDDDDDDDDDDEEEEEEGEEDGVDYDDPASHLDNCIIIIMIMIPAGVIA